MSYKPENLRTVLLDRPHIVIQKIAGIFGKKIPEKDVAYYRDIVIGQCFGSYHKPSKLGKEMPLSACVVSEVAKQMHRDGILKDKDIKRTLNNMGGRDGLIKVTDTILKEAIEDYFQSYAEFFEQFE